MTNTILDRPYVGQAGVDAATEKPLAYVFVDLETTGLSVLKHGICQIGAYATGVDENDILGYFVEDADPTYQGAILDEGAFKVNGFTQGRLYASRGIDTVLDLFKTYLKNIELSYTPVLVFHNAKFDVPFIECAYERAGIEFKFTRRVLCTISIAHAILGPAAPRSLEKLSKELGISNTQSHDALSDAITTSKVFHALMRRNKPFTQVVNIPPSYTITTPMPGSEIRQYGVQGGGGGGIQYGSLHYEDSPNVRDVVLPTGSLKGETPEYLKMGTFPRAWNTNAV